MTQSDYPLIVVGIDGSDGSLAALRWALAEGAKTISAVEVLHCYLPQTLTDLGFSKPHELHRASAIMLENEVNAAFADIDQAPPEVVRTSSLADPGRILVERSGHASLLVLGAHGRTAVRDLVFGRVGEYCRRRSGCPVVVVSPDHSIVRHGAINEGSAV